MSPYERKRRGKACRHGFNPVLRGGNSYSQEKGLWALGRYVS
jgi:hypothetical protein